jgi:hypothetical protein
MPYQSRTKPKRAGAEKKSAVGKTFALWSQIPQWLNLFKYRLQPEQQEDVLDYEPIHLHVSPGETQLVTASGRQAPGKAGSVSKPAILSHELKQDNFRFLLEQVPTVRTIEFSGRVDPFHNPYLMELVETAYKYNGAEVTIYTDGLLLEPAIDAILKSHLHTLALRTIALRPSQYARLSGLPADQYLAIQHNLLSLLQRRQQLRTSVEIDLCLMVDLHNFREIPAMIQQAETLGVDGIRFENYVSPGSARKSDRTLYTYQKPVTAFLKWVETVVLPVTRMSVTLPPLLDVDMAEYRHCLDPFTTVSVDAEFNISGCSRRLLLPRKSTKTWDQNFWNNDMYRWLRSIHGNPDAMKPAEVPMACQHCPRNMPCPSSVSS